MQRQRIEIKLVLLAAILFNTGCASYLVARDSQREISRNRIVASQDKNALEYLRCGIPPEVAIRAIPINNGIGLGVDLFSLDVLTNQPSRQIAAAVIDAILAYGAYKGIQSINNSGGTTYINNFNFIWNTPIPSK